MAEEKSQQNKQPTPNGNTAAFFRRWRGVGSRGISYTLSDFQCETTEPPQPPPLCLRVKLGDRSIIIFHGPTQWKCSILHNCFTISDHCTIQDLDWKHNLS